MTRLRKQRGIALLLLLAVIVMGAAWWIVSVMATKSNRVALERSQNAPVLRLAKQALIGYVAQQAGTDDLNPGSLPCPEATAYIDTANEGIAAGTCTLPAAGRLPWRTLGIEKPHDAAGEPLWYIVSSGWAKPNTSTPTLGINANSLGNLTVDGQANAAVAVIVAPGPPINVAPNANQIAAGCVARAQVRMRTAPNPLDYVECQNVAAGVLRTSVVDNATNPVFNDQVIAVSAAEVMAAIEPVVAARIQRDVVPQLQSIYANPTWGAGISAANPLFPFAVQYGDPATSPTSSFKGTAGTTQGLLPISSSVCNTMTNGPCDASFVQWDTTSISVAKRSGTANIDSTDCTASTGSQLRCDVTYSRTCGGLGCVLGCPCPATLEASVLASAQNVGLSMRRFTAAPVTGFSSLVSTNTPLAANGAANVDIRGNLPSDTCTAWLILGILFPCTAGGTVTLTVPIGVFPDHAFLNAQGPTPTSLSTTPDPWFWFLVNKWHYVTYYAVAPLHGPGAVGNCTGTNCISVTVQAGTNLSGERAVLILAGHSLNGTSGSNRTLTDFLDSAENTNLDLKFEQNKNNRFFNDRVVGVSP